MSWWLLNCREHWACDAGLDSCFLAVDGTHRGRMSMEQTPQMALSEIPCRAEILGSFSRKSFTHSLSFCWCPLTVIASELRFLCEALLLPCLPVLDSVVSLASRISPFVLHSIIHKSALLCGHLSVYSNEGDRVCNCLLNGLLNSVVARGTSQK